MAKTRTRSRTSKTPRPASRPATVVDLRKPLPTRRRTPVGPYSPADLAAALAALASAMARLPIPVLAWNGPTAHLADGTRITHTDHRSPAHTTVARPPKFTVAIPCPRGGIHHHTIHNANDLTQARAVTAACNELHGASPDQRAALTSGIPQAQQPRPVVTPLAEGLRRKNAATSDTQPLDIADITAGLTERQQTKEHPQP